MSTQLSMVGIFSGVPDPTGQRLTGEDLKQSGIQSALDHVLKVKAEYVDRCLFEISQLQPETTITSEDLRELAGDPPEEVPNCIAGILKRAASQNLIVNTGEERTARRTTIHAKKLCVWRKL
jgi:hypothetical protein